MARPIAVPMMPDSRQRGVNDAVRPEVVLQPFGDAVDPAERADVLAHQQGLRVVGQDLVQPGGDGLGHGHGGGHQGACPFAVRRFLVGEAGLVLPVPVQLLRDQRVRPRHSTLAKGCPDRVRGSPGLLADAVCQLLAVRDHLVEERLVGQVSVAQVLLQPGQRVAVDPGLLVGGSAVLRGVVRGGVCAHRGR